MTNLERSLLNNTQRMSLPNISRAVQFEESGLPPQVHFDHRGAHGLTHDVQGTQWHQLEHVTEEPELGVVNEQLGAGGGIDWRDLERLGTQTDHTRFHHNKRPK